MVGANEGHAPVGVYLAAEPSEGGFFSTGQELGREGPDRQQGLGANQLELFLEEGRVCDFGASADMLEKHMGLESTKLHLGSDNANRVESGNISAERQAKRKKARRSRLS